MLKLFDENRLLLSESWLVLVFPQAIFSVKSSDAKILWDFSLNTDHNHSSNYPDIVLFDYPTYFIYIKVSWTADMNLVAGLPRGPENVGPLYITDTGSIQTLSCKIVDIYVAWVDLEILGFTLSGIEFDSIFSTEYTAFLIAGNLWELHSLRLPLRVIQ